VPPSPGDQDRRGILVGALAGLIILMAAVVIVISNRSHSPSGTIGVGVATTVAAVPTPTAATTATTIPVVVPTTMVATTTVVMNGHLVVGSSHKVDLGTTASSASVIVGNDGQAPLTFTAAASGAGLAVDPVAGTLGSGASASLSVTLDRSLPSQGPFTGSIQIANGTGNATITVTVTALVDSGPMISGETATPIQVVTAKCTKLPHQPTMSTVTASVSGSMPLKLVVLHWQGTGSNGSGTATMTLAGSDYAAPLPAFALASPVEWWVTAIDNAGVTATSMTHSLVVVPC
jgi:hypothetical protein